MPTAAEIASNINAKWPELSREGGLNRQLTLEAMISQMEKKFENIELSPWNELHTVGVTKTDEAHSLTLADLNKAIQEMVKERNLAVERLTSEQLSEAISQALQSGDFMRYVLEDDGRQQVVYIPFQREEESKTKFNAITEMLSRFLVAHRDVARCWIEAFVECGAITADFNYHPLYPFIEPVKKL